MAIVKKAFKHLNTGRTYAPGDVFEGTASAEAELVGRGFLEAPPADPRGMSVRELRDALSARGVEVPAKARKAELLEMYGETGD